MHPASASSGEIVVGLGEILWDLLPGGKQLGGAPANFAYHAQAQGARGVVVSCVGDDALGAEILGRLDQAGLDRQYVQRHPSAPTGTVEVRLDAQGVPEYVIHRDVAWDVLEETPALASLAGRADAICFGSLAQRSEVTRRTIYGVLDSTRSQCVRVFDINLRQSFFSEEIVRESLTRCDVLKLNDLELPVLAVLLDLPAAVDAAMRELAQRYSLRAVALTRGSAGSWLYVDGKMLEHPGYPADLVDTVGAGDSFTAALTLGLVRREPMEKVHDRANRVASFVCSRAGAMPEIPAEILA